MLLSLIKDQLKDWIILVVDDEQDSLEVASRWLSLAGAQILTASDGRAGLDLIRKQPPDLVITDLSMPEMDGWELLYEMRLQPETASIPVIALTAHVMDNVQERASHVGFAGYIAKPLVPTKFVSQVIEMAKNGATRRPDHDGSTQEAGRV